MKRPLEDCPHFDGCNAALCPLEASGIHLKDEPVCRLAREIVKDGGYAHVAGYAGEDLAQRVLEGLPRLQADYDINRRLLRAATTPINVGRVGNLMHHGKGTSTSPQAPPPETPKEQP